MINKIIKKLGERIITGSIFLATVFSNYSYADDILKGVKGKTNWQMDERIAYSKSKDNIETITNNLIIKYWGGDKIGKWGFINLPYKSVDSPNGNNNGLGDISVGIGPRGIIKNIHCLVYSGLTLPTGSSEAKIPLGNGRYDVKFGGLFTYLTTNKTFEINAALEYNFTGENKSNINPPNEKYFGIIAGGKLTDNIRFATGITDLIKENKDYLANWRGVIRYTLNPTTHFEAVGDIGLRSRNIEKGKVIGIYIRKDF